MELELKELRSKEMGKINRNRSSQRRKLEWRERAKLREHNEKKKNKSKSLQYSYDAQYEALKAKNKKDTEALIEKETAEMYKAWKRKRRKIHQKYGIPYKPMKYRPYG